MAIHTIKTEVVVGDDHQISIQLPKDVPTGKHRVVVTVDDAEAASIKERPWRFPIFEGMKWVEGTKLDRASFYDD